MRRLRRAVAILVRGLLAWTAMLALAGHDARQWEPKTLRHRLFTIAATLARTTRQRLLHIKPTAPRADLFTPHGPCLAALAHTLTSEPVPSNPAPPRPWKTTPTGSDIPANAARYLLRVPDDGDAGR